MTNETVWFVLISVFIIGICILIGKPTLIVEEFSDAIFEDETRIIEDSVIEKNNIEDSVIEKNNQEIEFIDC